MSQNASLHTDRFIIYEGELAALTGCEEYRPEGPAQDTRALIFTAWEYGILVDTVMPLPDADGGDPQPWLMWEHLGGLWRDTGDYRWLLDTGNNDFMIASHNEFLWALGCAHKDSSEARSGRAGPEAARDVIREAAFAGNLLVAQFASYTHGRLLTGKTGDAR